MSGRVDIDGTSGAWQLQRRAFTFWMLLVPVVGLAMLFIGPVLQLIWLSFAGEAGPTLGNYVELGRPVYARLIFATFQLAFIITILCLLIGYPIAYLIAAVGGVVARWIAVLLILSLWLSILTRTYGWVALLQRNGLVNNVLVAGGIVSEPLQLLYNYFGVAVGMLHLLLPFMVITLLPTIRSVDEALVRASLSLGASPWQTFFKVFLPLTLPGVIAGSTLVFVMALGYFVTPAILGGGHTITIAMAIQNQVLTLVDLPLAASTSVVLLAISLGALFLYESNSRVERLFGTGANE
jgi:ABC-type spermidine/putrescine transport system permease subunit I